MMRRAVLLLAICVAVSSDVRAQISVYDPAVTGSSGYWVYAPGEIAPYVDAIRIMGYDYSVAEPGPIAPLAWVQQAVDGVSKAVPE